MPWFYINIFPCYHYDCCHGDDRTYLNWKQWWFYGGSALSLLSLSLSVSLSLFHFFSLFLSVSLFHLVAPCQVTWYAARFKAWLHCSFPPFFTASNLALLEQKMHCYRTWQPTHRGIKHSSHLLIRDFHSTVCFCCDAKNHIQYCTYMTMKRIFTYVPTDFHYHWTRVDWMSFESQEKCLYVKITRLIRHKGWIALEMEFAQNQNNCMQCRHFFEHSLLQTSNRDTVIPIKVIAHFHKINTAPWNRNCFFQSIWCIF